MTRRVAGVIAAAAIVLGGCSDSGSPAAQGEGWTILHYSMADTDLEGFMVADLNEMGAVGSQGDLKVRAFVDRSPEYSADPVLDVGDWVGAKVLDIGEGTAEVVDDIGDVDSADPETLATFIAEGIEAHPAANYALIISDHGASWPGIGPDETADYDVLDLAEMTEGIRDGLDAAGVNKLDLLGFDACLMASYEVASAVAPLADRLVASQELEPGHGWDYTSLQVLADNPDTSTDAFGRALVDGFKGQAEEEGTESSITLALFDLSKMDAVDDAIEDFAGALEDAATDVAPVVGRAEAASLGFARSPDETEDSHLKDLAQLAEAIGEDSDDVASEADALVEAVDDVVIRQVAGEATRSATGLSIYFPPSADLAADAYGDVETASAWRDFLAAYYDAGENIPERELPEFVAGDDGAALEFDEDGVTISAAFEEAGADNLVEAMISYAIVNDDGSLTYFGEEFADIAEDGTPEAAGFYDITALTITDGEDTAYAYLSLYRGEDDEVFTVDVPMAYYPVGEDEDYEDVLLTLTIDAEGEIIDETYYVFDEESGTYGELDADPAAIIVPEVLRLDAEGEEVWESTTDVGLYADLESLEYNLEPVAAGTKVQLDLTVFDYGDNSDTVSGVFTVE